MFGYANPKKYKTLSHYIFLTAVILATLFLGFGLYLALIASPPDYQQSETVRIMYVHVPAAWLSMFIYVSMAVAALVLTIWKHTLAGFYIRAAAPIGAAFTAACLISGALWGQPTWGTWWVWDARLTSVLILFFLYLGAIALNNAYDNPDKGNQASAWLVLIGSVNLPIIKFSVEWWNTLHQPASLTSLSKITSPGIHPDMLTPLLVMAFGFLCLYGAMVILRLDNEILGRKIHVLRLRTING
ncbi:MAG: cytochrome C biogenesis protein CcmC [Micavibrio sp.]|nr:MAG: cytochrome C biogenesis protein CcmC [Micavibrio sp.]